MKPAYVTKVIRVIERKLPALLLGLWLAAGCAGAQNAPGAALPDHPAQDLYLQLRSVGLDKSRVYKIRGAALDRAAFHVTFEDGVIAFTEDVAGRITGAFFEGDGEILLSPRDQPERASMTLFTGAAILEERFLTAYFRFNDDTFRDVEPALRPADNAAEFASQWNETARRLAEIDALRLLLSFSHTLPVAGQVPPPGAASQRLPETDRMLHARVQGRNLGTFDLYFDSLSAEQVWAGQLKTTPEASYYDVWTSFSSGAAASSAADASGVVGENAQRDGIEVSKYEVRAKVEPPRRLEADATVQINVRQGGQRSLLFELSRFLQVTSVEADSQAIEFIHNQALEGTELARRGNDLVAVVFPRTLRDGQTIGLHFTYGGEVLSEAREGLLYVGARGTWYPNRGLEMANFDLSFRYPAGWTLVATGKRVEDTPAGGNPGEQRSHWVSDRPMPLAGFNLGKYSRVAARAGDVQVEAYATDVVERSFPQAATQAAPPSGPFGLRRPATITVPLPPPSPARNAQAVANASARAVEFFAQRFGPYPYPGLALTQMPGELSQGWPSLVFLSSFSFLTPQQKSELHMDAVARSLSNSVIAHETAHQWWGDLVSWKSYRDQWLFEALANYSALMLLENDSPQEFRAVMEKYRSDLLANNKEGTPHTAAGPVSLSSRLTCSHFPDGYETVVYGRGTWLLHMLRSMMRDAEAKSGKHSRGTTAAESEEPFLRALAKVVSRYQGRSISTRDFLRVVEEELPLDLRFEGRKSLDWFYEGWVNGTAVPRLHLQDVRVSGRSAGALVTGTIVQEEAPSSLVTAVPVYAMLAGKPVLLGQVFADGPETSFRLPVPAGVRKIVLNSSLTLLTRP